MQRPVTSSSGARWWLRAAVVAVVVLSTSLTISVASAATTVTAPHPYAYDQVGTGRLSIDRGVRSFRPTLGDLAVLRPAVFIRFGVAAKSAKGGDEAYHYTFRGLVQSIEKQGLRLGSYAALTGKLSPLQAQIDLALPPNRGLRDAVVRVDLAGLRRAGYDVPDFTRVGRKFYMPGGGYEVQFPYAVPPEFVRVVRP